MDASNPGRDAYAAKIKREFDETASSNPYYAQYRARKTAHDAKKTAAESEAAAVPPKAVSAPLAAISGSDSDDPKVLLPAWEPRKQRLKKEPARGSSSIGNVPPFNDETTPDPSPAGVPFRAANAAVRSAGAPTTSSAGVKSTLHHPNSTGGAVKDEDAEKAAHKAKRPAESDHNDRGPKAANKTSESSATSTSESPAPATTRTGADREPPAWYKQLAKPKGERARNQSDAEISIARLKAAITRAKSAWDKPAPMAKECEEIVERLHALVFLPVDGKLLRQMRILDNKDGLPQLFDDEFAGQVEWPWYLKADAEELYNKWCTGMFETDLYRGIERSFAGKKGGRGKGKADVSAADSLKPDYKRFRLMDPKQHGNGLLLNGAWWPSQLAALRDGGHGASQGGITGSPTSGAYSVIMAGGVDPAGQPYPNEDRGSEVLYCGTDNKEKDQNQPSLETRSLLTNHRIKQPVRLFRSHNLRTPFAPELGFRYDGLYDVAGYEEMDPPDNKRRRHRFKPVRRAGQDPIRSEGAAKRPTKQEIDEYEKDKKNRGR